MSFYNITLAFLNFGVFLTVKLFSMCLLNAFCLKKCLPFSSALNFVYCQPFLSFSAHVYICVYEKQQSVVFMFVAFFVSCMCYFLMCLFHLCLDE